MLVLIYSGYSPQKLTVRIGSQHHTEGGTIEKLKEVHVHEDYNPSTVDFDYSLLKLKTPLNFTDLVQPILLSAIDEAEIPDQTLCTVSGWGNTMNSSESTLKLRAATVPIVNQDICVEKYETKAIVTPRMICAGFDEGGKDCKLFFAFLSWEKLRKYWLDYVFPACQGDSGGPLTCIDPTDDKRKIYGIVSWGYGCARKDYPGVYGRVSAARKWIKKMTNI